MSRQKQCAGHNVLYLLQQQWWMHLCHEATISLEEVR